MSPNYRIEMDVKMGSLTKDRSCEVCVGRNKTLQVYHHHFSTAFYNKQMGQLYEDSPMCHFCNIPHTVDNRSRKNVILTTSTLAGTQYLQGWGWQDEDPLHCDVEAIPGANIDTLRRAWERSYGRNTLPIDTLLIAGLIDVREKARHYLCMHTMEQTAELASEDIMDCIRKLNSQIVEHSKNHKVKNTLAVATILHVPAMYWHQHDGPLPGPDYINMKPIIDMTNFKIEAFNKENGVTSAPKLHQTGERTINKGKKLVFTLQSFMEDSTIDKMHLTDEKKFKMMKCCIKYFRKATAPSYHLS